LEDYDFLGVLAAQLILSLLFMLKFLSAPTFGAAVVFAWINGIFALFLFVLVQSHKSPIEITGDFHITEALPFIFLGILGIYVIARAIPTLMPGLFLVPEPVNPFPDFGTVIAKNLALDQAGAAPQSQNALEVIAWNFSVSAAEETMKIVLVVLLAIFLIHEVAFFNNHSKLGLAVALGLVIVAIWTYLHQFQAFTQIGELLVAFLAGGVLLAEILKLRNYLAAVFTHLGWNLLVSFTPNICLVPTLLCKPPALALFGLQLPVISGWDPYILFLLILAGVSYYFTRKRT